MNKILLDTELSIQYGVCHVNDTPSINETWLSFTLYFDEIYSLIADHNNLSSDLIKITKYPIDEILKIKITNRPVTDSLEIKLRLIFHCLKNDILFYPVEADNDRASLINEAGKYIPESINFLKRSFITIDIVKLIIVNQLPVEGYLSEDLARVIKEFKKTEQLATLRTGIEDIVNINSGSYYLSQEIESNIQSMLIMNQAEILDLLDFDKITTFDFSSLVSDGVSVVGGLLTPFLPLSTIKEMYDFVKKRKKIKDNKKLLFTLSTMYLRKLLSQNTSYTTKEQCGYCKLTSIEIDRIDAKNEYDAVFNLLDKMCSKHRLKYLELRKFKGLMGKPLLKEMIENDDQFQ